MRAVPVALACALIPAVAGAEVDPEHSPAPTSVETTAAPVVGGTNAPAGKWPDAAAILFGGQQACTGTLVAPTVALTAGHCNDASLNEILVGTTSLSRPADGERLAVKRRIELQQNDITVLVLETPSAIPPRAIATGWAKFDIKNGAKAQVVGYGAINANATQFVDELQEAEITITDFDCSVSSGCDNFEVGAGGGGIDSCNGDSGGPLYLVTDYGNFLVGVTSRAYSNATKPCGEGGIYGRPDQVIDFIESAAGVPVTHGPEPTLDRQLIAIRGDAGEAQIEHNDPKAGASHTFTLTTPPTKGQAAISSSGVLRVCVAQDATPGDTDSVVVTVADSSDPNRSVAQRFTISVAANDPETSPCDPMAFGIDDGGGCCDSGGRGAGGSALLSLFALGVLVTPPLRRRRRRR